MKTSAGLLVWRRSGEVGDEGVDGTGGGAAAVEVLIAHPGGPLFGRKDDGVWSIPKGEYEAGDEEPLAAALREFAEEIGQPAPAGPYVQLGDARQIGRKINTIYATEGDLDVSSITSNYFEMEWPPHSGRLQSYPEMDRAGWFTLTAAGGKLFSSQRVFLDRLAELLT